MKLLKNKTVADIVTENINTAKIFEKYNIDFGFNGNVVLQNACKKNRVDLAQISKELQSVNQKRFYLKDYQSWDLDLLLAFLEDIHHQKKKEDINTISSLNEDIYAKYALCNEEIKTQYEIIKKLIDLVSNKMSYEEAKIFPYIKKLNTIYKEQVSNTVTSDFLNKTIKDVEREILEICTHFKRIIKITNNFNFPEHTDLKLKLLFRKLRSFYKELQEHNHVEKNILLPKAIELEKNLLAARI